MTISFDRCPFCYLSLPVKNLQCIPVPRKLSVTFVHSLMLSFFSKSFTITRRIRSFILIMILHGCSALFFGNMLNCASNILLVVNVGRHNIFVASSPFEVNFPCDVFHVLDFSLHLTVHVLTARFRRISGKSMTCFRM